MATGVRAVVGFAVFTRLGSLALQALLNSAIPDHDADAFSPPPAEDPLLLDPVAEVLLGGLGRWDAQHFLFIAERGYVFEHNFAFFPLLPIVLRCVAVVLLWPLAAWLSLHGRLLVAVALLNSALFVLSAAALYGLGCLVLQDRRLSLLSALLYCLTPANVFFVAGYSESLYAALTFGGLWLLERGSTAKACLVLGLATGARANGLVNSGFLLYLSLKRALSLAQPLWRSSSRDGWNFMRCMWIAFRFIATAVIWVLVICLPFAIFQFYGYTKFCETPSTLEPVSPVLLSLAQVKGYRVPDPASPAPPWCSRPLPLLYSYLQDVYWDVGFLRYFQLKQIPNFLLASPVSTLGSLAAYLYLRADPRYCLRLGLAGSDASKERDEKAPTGFHSRRVFVYVVHATVLLLSGFFCMHVQVLTRFLGSSSPVIYWISAHLLLSHEPLLADEHTKGKKERMPIHRPLFGIPWGRFHQNPITELLTAWTASSFVTKCILRYFMSYWVIGLALHCNFLPWT
ncbi:palmitoyltransferase ZDHHC18-A [Engraulis encrasicolus]|uniref:palmitoyltransferase ZDHHC18-A n=1 Tax=Engraulis encrasicolus TaxID=184585 RepID=UPI002FD16BD4